MRIHNLYEDADGKSHFRDVEVDWVEETPSGEVSNAYRRPASCLPRDRHGLREQLAPGRRSERST